MDNYHEKPFKINGIDSWIHCIGITIDSPTGSLIPHYHYHKYIEFLYSVESDANVWISGNCYPFKTGDFIIINSNSPHDVVFSGYSKYIVIKFWPQILYSDQNALFEFKYLLPFLIDKNHKKLFHKEEIESAGIPSLCEGILTEWELKNPAYELVIRSDILRIFAWIFRYWHSQLNFPEATIPDSIKKAINFVGENFTTVTERQVADYCGLTYNHFSFLFRQSIGKTFSDYVLSLKLKEAEKLLISTDLTITDIALETGFSTSSHFIAKFKNQKGITPSRFRKQLTKI